MTSMKNVCTCVDCSRPTMDRDPSLPSSFSSSSSSAESVSGDTPLCKRQKYDCRYQSSSAESVSGDTPLHKCQKYGCRYQSLWERDEKFGRWVRKSKKGSDYAFCTFCAKDIKIAGGGANDLSRHGDTMVHRRSTESTAVTPNIATLMAASTTMAIKAIKSEVLFASFIAEHNIPMNVSDHAGKLFRAMFPDSDIAKSFCSGRTKTTQIIKGALSSYYTRPVIEAMRQGPFSLLMDETTDNTAEKEAVLLNIFFDNNLGRIVCLFYGLPVCNIATGQTLFELIEDAFTKDNIPWGTG